MSQLFQLSRPPFNQLSGAQQARLQAALQLIYVRAHQVLLEPDSEPEGVLVIVKGSVEERSRDGHTHFGDYGPDDAFDIRAQFDGRARHRFTALEECLCLLIPRPLFLALCEESPHFVRYFRGTLLERQQEAGRHGEPGQQNLSEFLLTRINAEHLQPPLILTPDHSLADATRAMAEAGCDCLLWRNGIGPWQLATRTTLLHALVLHDLTPASPLQRLAPLPVPLVALSEGDYLFDALILMTRHRVKRVVITRGEAILGTLHLSRVLGLFSTHSHVLTLRIHRAGSEQALEEVAREQGRLAANLFAQGIHTAFLLRLMSAVNEQLIAKAFELTLPASLHPHLCLLALGSEGRGEQVQKTDQDNALILTEGLDWPDRVADLARFNALLVRLGYPLCPGNVMVTNPDWVKTPRQWQQAIDIALIRAEEQDLLWLSTLADAHPVAGNPTLLPPITAHLRESLAERTDILAEMARAAVAFHPPLTLFGRLEREPEGLDLKRGGLFALIHGCRLLALEAGIAATSTLDRIEALVSAGRLSRDYGNNLGEAFRLFVRLRLRSQFDRGESRLAVASLSVAERDLLRHSLHVVKKFQQWLALHFRVRQ
ncbi:putative nucleotidyltransferase substrate binding domain-containing protein [Aeromonas diversa]|uniref:putative nucleotidyltransferase substrate binding domain-containing protein n=1 Tax=Aeromonas diversa TaxID=502790 RepID=UPI0039A12A4B